MSTPETPPTINALVSQARDALLLGHTAEARTLCGEALRALAAAADDDRYAAAVCVLFRLEARAHAVDGDLDAALDALTAAGAIAELVDDAGELGQTRNNMAGVNLQRGDLDAAEALYASARAHAERAGDQRLFTQVALNRGIVANIRGDLAAARAHYVDALEAARVLDMPREVALALNNLGMVHADLGEWDRAEGAYEECAAVCDALHDLDTLTRVHVNRAEVWVGRGDLARARLSCDAALATSLRSGLLTVRGEVHKQLGVVAREEGVSDEAEHHFALAAAVAETRSDLLLLAETAREQADLFRRQGRNRDTLQALNRAHALFTRLRAGRDLADVARRMGRLEDEFVAVARRWGESIEANDRYTQGHCQRVADLACLIAEQAGPAHGFDAQAMFWFRIGALLHDVGKLEVPAEVLNKPGKLTDAEWAMMRGHAEAGVALLADVEFPWDVRPIVLSHHERWDGKGYPHHLAGEAIPLPARVLAVADVYDALTSVRSYKRAMSHEEACAILRKDAGSAFDPQVIAWFEAVAPQWAARLAALPPDPLDAPAETAARQARVRATRRALGLDELTGLPGRRAFRDECARVLVARADGRSTVGLLLVRVDGLAACWAAHGAMAVEAALLTVADVLSRNTRGGDFVGRYAAHEFVVLLPDLDAGATRDVADRLLDALAEARGMPDVLDIVTGAAVSRPGDAPDLLLAAADAALARARHPGRVAPTARAA